MKPEQKRAINRTILKCRNILENDIENRLVTYGILMDESWIEKDKLSLSDEQEQTYRDLRDAITKEMKGGLSEMEALVSYIREVTYTYLNRIAALRVMEVRGLMEEVLVQREEYSNRSYGHRNFFEIAREFCKSQSDEGLSYFISLVFNEISNDIGLLFNTDDEYSIIGPSNKALLEIIQQLTTEVDEESWRQDEIIGWIYQYFNEEEKDDVFDRLYNKKENVKSIDIPAATQLFTPDWIVEWIVNNSLGKLREEIINGERENKKLEEIKLLDPSCGSGHFLIKAYDLFYQYYVEEGYPKEKIPFLILTNNLHGIDIDARAIQLTALILYIKVRVSLKEAGVNEISDSQLNVNLVCADAVLLNGDRLAKMKKQFENNPTILQMIEIIYEEFSNTRLKGSLIQPEKRVIPLIEEYKQKKQKDLKKKKNKEDLGLFEGFDDFRDEQEEAFLSQSEKELFQYLEQIYTQATKVNDINNQLFANEARKSVLLLNIFLQKYDVVVANPPYMGRRNMNETLRTFIDKYYKIANADFYSVFINRVLDFVTDDGFIGMVTQQSFMFIKSFEKLREHILTNFLIDNVVHLGPRAFDDISGEKVNTVMFCLTKNIRKKPSEFLRLVEYKTSTEKEYMLKNISRSNHFQINQETFNLIKGKPFIYWLGNELGELFKNPPLLGEFIYFANRTKTGNNSKFTRFWWEVVPENFGKEKDWVFYTKGGSFNRWYGNYDLVVDWREDTRKYFRKSKDCRITDREYWYREGITYSSTSGTGFAARYLIPECVYDVKGPAIFTDDLDLYYLLGFLNSGLFNYLISALNPTLEFQSGDIQRVPYLEPKPTVEMAIKTMTKRAVEYKRKMETLKETNHEFDGYEIKQGTLEDYLKNLSEFHIAYLGNITFFEDAINILINEKVYSLSEDTIRKINNFYNTEPHLIENTNVLLDSLETFIKETLKNIIPNIDEYFNGKDINDPSLLKPENETNSIIDFINEIAKENKVNPIDIKDSLKKCIENKKYNLFKNDIESLLSYFIGICLGRWGLKDFEINPNGIFVVDENNIENYLYEVIEYLFGEENFESIVDEEIPLAIGKTIHEWILKEFFNFHLREYRKRPIYWHVCSPNKSFNALLYYHALTSDTLYKLKSNHLVPKIDNLTGDLSFYREKMSSVDDKKAKKKFENRVTELERQINDLEALDNQINNIIASGYEPDTEKGVLYNIKPLNPILAKKIEK